MALFLTLLPLYILGNLHCIGMCGPLAMMIGGRELKWFYLAGRICSFTLAGGVAGLIGFVLSGFLSHSGGGAFFTLLFSSLFLLFACLLLLPNRGVFSLPSLPFVKEIEQRLTLFLLKGKPWALFLFGFFTVFLPCGQTVIVFSACALSASWVEGLFNGCAFALFTTPSLLFAMAMHRLVKRLPFSQKTFLAFGALLVASLGFCRAFASLGWIEHWVMPLPGIDGLHLVLY